MLAPNPSQHLELQSASQRNPSRFHQSVKRSNASENEQICPTTTVPDARGVDSRPHLASVLQEGRKSTNIHAGSGVIRGIPV